MFNFKKLTCLILASAMIVTATPQNAFADEIQTDGDVVTVSEVEEESALAETSEKLLNDNSDEEIIEENNGEELILSEEDENEEEILAEDEGNTLTEEENECSEEELNSESEENVADEEELLSEEGEELLSEEGDTKEDEEASESEEEAEEDLEEVSLRELTEEELKAKKELAASLGAFDEKIPGRDYVDKTVYSITEEEEEAEYIAQIYGIELSSCELSVATYILPEDISVSEIIHIAADLSNNYPAVFPDYIPEPCYDEERSGWQSSSPSGEDENDIQISATANEVSKVGSAVAEDIAPVGPYGPQIEPFLRESRGWLLSVAS